ncbi:MAG: glycosyltransferase family 4 protein [Myxococcales bacterium FL481]|nr:MAG: glycosyltransferase family 4 protein [Myxococcales bacterium FL481]
MGAKSAVPAGSSWYRSSCGSWRSRTSHRANASLRGISASSSVPCHACHPVGACLTRRAFPSSCTIELEARIVLDLQRRMSAPSTVTRIACFRSKRRVWEPHGACRWRATFRHVNAVSRVSVVCPDLSTNCLGRALILAELCRQDYEVQIVGLQRRTRRWEPARNTAIPIRARRLRGIWDCIRAVPWLRRQLVGSRVIVSKPVFTSLGLTRRAGVVPHQILLDNDDWEVGLRRVHGAKGGRRLVEFLDPTRFNGVWSTLAIDKTLADYPRALVSNSWLQKRYGGSVLAHVRDTDVLDPDKVDGDALRARLEMTGRVWIGFVGTPRAHKGGIELVDAVARFNGPNAPGLYLAGVDTCDGYAVALRRYIEQRLPAARIRVQPPFPVEQTAEHVALADIICLPSRDDAGAWGQLPAKLIDAIAMGKPTVASGHNDIVDILRGCGTHVRPGDAAALYAALQPMVSDATLRARLGARARQKAIDHYSHRAGRAVLRPLVRQIEPFV